MQRFWDEVLGPGLARWSRPAMGAADVVLTFDRAGRLSSVDLREV